MTEQAPFRLKGRNPDVLSCIANLSNDEVFTPPEFANRMLNTLAEAWAEDNDGENIWENGKVTFLDPCTKSGVFLREIAKRLIEGLADEIPDLQERVNHILTQQVFGIGITQLTALLARRSLYCSKSATGEHSVATGFDDAGGNIWFERTEHEWENGRCLSCGAPEKLFGRDVEQENYAYKFIHLDTDDSSLAEIFGGDMQFDVIIGNPPYQLAGGAGGSSASSIYHLFVEQAIQLEPRYLTMVIPSRWMAGGRGLGEFREQMLTSGNLVEIVDYPVSKEVFPGVEVKGGIGYFLWGKNHSGLANVTSIRGDEVVGPVKRKLDEFDVFVRDARAVKILNKVQLNSEKSIADDLTGDTPFGIASNFSNYRLSERAGDVSLYLVKKGKRIRGYMPRAEIRKNSELVELWKVFVPKAGSDGGQKIPDSVLGKPWLAGPNSICSQTFIAFSANTQSEAESILSYYCTKFFRFLVSIRKITQDALRGTYSWVPQQSWDRLWTDAELYQKYNLTEEEISYIESMIRPMDIPVE